MSCETVKVILLIYTARDEVSLIMRVMISQFEYNPTLNFFFNFYDLICKIWSCPFCTKVSVGKVCEWCRNLNTARVTSFAACGNLGHGGIHRYDSIRSWTNRTVNLWKSVYTVNPLWCHRLLPNPANMTFFSSLFPFEVLDSNIFRHKLDKEFNLKENW